MYYGIKEVNLKAKESDNIAYKSKNKKGALSFFTWGLSGITLLAYAILALQYFA